MLNFYTCVVELEVTPADHACGPDCQCWMSKGPERGIGHSKLIVFPELTKSERKNTQFRKFQNDVAPA